MASPSPADPGSPGGEPPILVGVDVGGSHTTAVLTRGSETILARADGPGAALRPGNADATARAIADVVGRAARLARVTLPADRAVVGAAGAGRDTDRAELTTRLDAHGLARRMWVTTDGEIALVAAFDLDPGIVVSAGTGSIAYARDRRGAIHRAGGYGWQLGDEGGGYWIGRQALAAVARAQDQGGEGQTLLPVVLNALAVSDFESLVRWAATATPPQVAALALPVLGAAHEGTAVGRQIMAAAAAALADLVSPLASHFPPDAPVSIAASGALLGPNSPLRGNLRALLSDRDPRLRWSDAVVDNPLGAVRIAADFA